MPLMAARGEGPGFPGRPYWEEFDGAAAVAKATGWLSSAEVTVYTGAAPEWGGCGEG